MLTVALLTRAMPSANAFVRRLSGVADLALVGVERPAAAAVDHRRDRPRALVELDHLRSLATRRAPRELRGALARAAERFVERFADPITDAERERAAIERVYGVLAHPVDPATPIEVIDHRAWESLVPSLERVRPDVIAVFGTSWIPEAVTRTARIAAINVHAGLAPHYRGNRCVEQAIIADDLENVGVTLHLVRPKIDAGEIVAQARPVLAADDDEHVLAHKVLDLGQRTFVDLVSALDAGARLVPVPQPENAGTYFATGAYGREHRRLVRRLIEGGLVGRSLERAARGRTRPKVIVEGLQLE
ncbi:hypothetical protein L6R52_36450 [Myxococcota bacterium]|nr:hypothetical protein [Myxococcota bacterium]